MLEREDRRMKYLQLYVHIPFCVKKCSYCDFLSFSCDEKTQRDYADALMREIAYYGKRYRGYMVDTIYIGGGTPSWLNEDKMVQILDTIYEDFMVLTDAEISMECNPGTVTEAKLCKYRQAGINRLSIGLQSADNEELQILGRIHTYEQFLKTYELAKKAGFTNINVDLMSGIPYQTTDKFLRTLQKVTRLRPSHISAYSLIIEKGTPFYENYKFDAVRQEAGMPTEILPTEDEVYRIYKMTQEYLGKAGYVQYEISNFALSGYACEHNIGYWTRKNYLGLGIGAASLIENVRYTNLTDIYDYIEESKHIVQNSDIGDTNLCAQVQEISRKEQMEEFMFLGLRMNEGVTRSDFFREFQIPIDGVYKEVCERMKEEGLLKLENGRICLTDRGMDLGNYVMSRFLLE